MLQQCPDILAPKWSWASSSAAVAKQLHIKGDQLVSFLAAAPQLLCHTPQEIEQKFKGVRAQLSGCHKVKEQDQVVEVKLEVDVRELLLEVPQLMVVPQSVWLGECG